MRSALAVSRGIEEKGTLLQKTSRVLQGAAGSPSVPLPFLPKLSRCPERSLGQDWGSPPGTHLLITAQSLLLPPPSIFLSSAGGKEPLRLWGPCACPLLTLHWGALGECQGCEGCEAFWAEQTEDPLGSHALCGGPKFTSLLSCELGREGQDTHSLPHPTGTPLQSVFSYGHYLFSFSTSRQLFYVSPSKHTRNQQQVPPAASFLATGVKGLHS